MIDSLPPKVKKNVKLWLSPPFDTKTIQEVENLLHHDSKSLCDRFSHPISFGTGGMRGLMGVGTNRINCYTIRAATHGLASYILKESPMNTPHHVFIGYDCRRNSREFAENSARVFAANGIRVYLTEEPCPTPYVSFGCRHLNCIAAVMITASHNPKDYNGYKVYWKDGAQIVPPQDSGIIREVEKIEGQKGIKIAPFDHPFIQMVDQEVKESYYRTLMKLENYPEENRKFGQNLHLVYSNLHGAGITFIPEALRRWGFKNLSLIEKQVPLDGDFPFAPSPNPEQAEALQMGSDLLKKERADLFIATDPDADRVGVVAYHQGKAVILSGNQIAAICVFYLCHTLNKLGKMPSKGAVVTTIVTTDLVERIASAFNVECVRVLTGFKYIGEKIREWEDGHLDFLFGAEESLGFLYGKQTRDKDSISASCLLSEIALQQKLQGKTVVDLLHTIYAQFGLFHEKQLSIPFGSSLAESEKMRAHIEKLRDHPPTAIGDKKVVGVEDYKTGLTTYSFSKKKQPIPLPKADVLTFLLEDKSKLIVRPSGTEPKVKIYGMTHQNLKGREADAGLKRCDLYLKELLERFREDHFV